MRRALAHDMCPGVSSRSGALARCPLQASPRSAGQGKTKVGAVFFAQPLFHSLFPGSRRHAAKPRQQLVTAGGGGARRCQRLCVAEGAPGLLALQLHRPPSVGLGKDASLADNARAVVRSCNHGLEGSTESRGHPAKGSLLLLRAHGLECLAQIRPSGLGVNGLGHAICTAPHAACVPAAGLQGSTMEAEGACQPVDARALGRHGAGGL